MAGGDDRTEYTGRYDDDDDFSRRDDDDEAGSDEYSFDEDDDDDGDDDYSEEGLARKEAAARKAAEAEAAKQAENSAKSVVNGAAGNDGTAGNDETAGNDGTAGNDEIVRNDEMIRNDEIGVSEAENGTPKNGYVGEEQYAPESGHTGEEQYASESGRDGEEQYIPESGFADDIGYIPEMDYDAEQEYFPDTGYSDESAYARGSYDGDAMQEPVTRYSLPADISAERNVIACMLMNPDAISDVGGILKKEDFFERRYGVLFEAIVSLHEEGRAVDEVLLAERLRAMGAPETLCSLDFLGDILASAVTSYYAKEYATVVKDKATLRALIHTADDIAKECYEAKDSVENIMGNAENSLFKLVESQGRDTDFVPMQRVTVNVIRDIEEASKREGRIAGLPMGFLDLDYKLAGMKKGELIIVAARPGLGKTAFGLNIAQNVLLNEGVPVAIFNLEMTKEALVSRILSMVSEVDSQNIRTGNLTETEWDKLFEGVQRISSLPLYIDDDNNITMPKIRAKCRKLKRTKGLGLVIIDYIGLMNPTGRVESRQLFIAEVSRSLKALAKELQIPVIALSQLNRGVEGRTDHRPGLADLRESGAIEQDADVVMFVYRDDYYHPEDSKEPGVAEIIIAKQRGGSTGTVKLLWDGKYTKFRNKKFEKK